MKWFSIEGIFSEIRKIRWPSFSELVEKSSKTVFFILLFMAFFVVCALFISWFLGVLGIA